MAINGSNLIWIDLEMTGLDPDNDHIIEIATVVTDKNLNILARGPVFAINWPEEIIGAMDAWNTTTHTESGLVKRIREEGVALSYAEEETIKFLSGFAAAGVSPMCGNSICQDRRFLVREMPNLAEFFHYRNLDVSSIKELMTRWRPELTGKNDKKSVHTALADIIESIAELEFYRRHFFR